ncbi:DUF427 domain-containing protein [Devosia rhodophyticola]|uniref:DUF427 domain-containing protein n=1 Tax=Devosia rhodophyticola TaxID=3026423 RepID=A0ABY7YZF2_9HYPH|nr:DUF427 domain-containing protein [Devosia rhodophyticola]WDR06617.1 DUF427 domain-containing protein [Devosia rhodophyticola]
MTEKCQPKDIKIRPATGRVRVIFDDAEIVSTIHALEVDEPGAPVRLYIPRDEVRPDILETSDTTSHSPYMGDAAYFTLKTLTATAEDAVWYYPDPGPSAQAIRDHLVFWGDKIKFERDDA